MVLYIIISFIAYIVVKTHLGGCIEEAQINLRIAQFVFSVLT